MNVHEALGIVLDAARYMADTSGRDESDKLKQAINVVVNGTEKTEMTEPTKAHQCKLCSNVWEPGEFGTTCGHAFNDAQEFKGMRKKWVQYQKMKIVDVTSRPTFELTKMGDDNNES